MARSFLIKSLFLICLLFGFSESIAQQIEVRVLPDTTTFLIGEQINIKLEAKIPENGDINFPVINDTLIKEVEIIEVSPIDSVEENGNKRLWMDLTITSFDSGFHAIPPLQFIGREPGNTLKSYLTEAFLLEVQTVAVDTSKAIMGIKEPIVVPISFQEMLPYILSGILILGLAALGFWFWKKQKNKPVEEKKEIIPQEPPHVIALRDLNQLKTKGLWQKGEFKNYHSELTEIIRRYIENRYKIPALEQVSDEILQSFSNSGVLKEKEYDNLRSMLNLADMVKFAKVHPLPNENERSMEQAVEFVTSNNYSSIPDSIESSEKQILSEKYSEESKFSQFKVKEKLQQQKVTAKPTSTPLGFLKPISPILALIKKFGLVYRFIGIVLAVFILIMSIKDIAFLINIENPPQLSLSELRKMSKEDIPRYLRITNFRLLGSSYISSEKENGKIVKVTFPLYSQEQIHTAEELGKESVSCYLLFEDRGIKNEEALDEWMLLANANQNEVEGKYDSDIQNLEDAKNLLRENDIPVDDDAILITRENPPSMPLAISLLIFSSILLCFIGFSFIPQSKIQGKKISYENNVMEDFQRTV